MLSVEADNTYRDLRCSLLNFKSSFCQSTGSDKNAIVAVLGARTNKQRQEIAAKYQPKYGKVTLLSLLILYPDLLNELCHSSPVHFV